MFLQETRQVDAEVSEREVGDGYAAAEVFKVDDGILELEELLAAVFQVVHLVAGLVLDDVLFACGGNIEQHHAAADALFEVDVLLQLHVGPEVDELDALVVRADTVDAAKPLDDAHRVPVDVVVDDGVAVLEVLAFADAVGGDEQIEFPFSGEILGTLFGAGREGRDDADEILAEFGQRGLVVAGTGDEGGMQPETLLCPRGKLLIEILSRIGERGEDDDLAIARVERLTALALDDAAEIAELGITRRACFQRTRSTSVSEQCSMNCWITCSVGLHFVELPIAKMAAILSSNTKSSSRERFDNRITGPEKSFKPPFANMLASRRVRRAS